MVPKPQEIAELQPEDMTYQQRMENTTMCDYSELEHKDDMKKKSIKTDLGSYDIPDDIKRKADEIFMKFNAVCKGSQRKKAIISCLHEAYRISDCVPMSKKQIAQMIGYEGDLNRCDLLMYHSSSTYVRESRYRGPLEFIPSFLDQFQVAEEHWDEIMTMAKEVIAKDDEENEDLDQKKPNIVAIAFIKYYFDTNGIAYDGEKMMNTIDRKMATIDEVIHIIQDLENM